MRRYFGKAVQVLKVAMIGVGIILCLLNTSLWAEQQAVQQCFDLKTSAIISIGFSSALCMVIHESKKR